MQKSILIISSDKLDADGMKAHIKGLRKKLSDVETTYIKNVWGIGYYFHDNEKISKYSLNISQ